MKSNIQFYVKLLLWRCVISAYVGVKNNKGTNTRLILYMLHKEFYINRKYFFLLFINLQKFS